ncbi:DUF4261 domain-containing protein [Inconstantimicrobium porci]|uniref:DUF4261 domain-containing protein n=1 Tax=Inconstantimicrobium porci TaxID=2652291 RepID=UPI001F357866|nr:DUF4261 domain-containing protein [Inconstantimicrobium porci]
MSTLYLPDVQYHFHGVDPNWVVNHAYNLLSYIYDNNSRFHKTCRSNYKTAW